MNWKKVQHWLNLSLIEIFIIGCLVLFIGDYVEVEQTLRMTLIVVLILSLIVVATKEVKEIAERARKKFPSKKNKPLRAKIVKSRRGQVWVETVIYTLIALVLIGTVLAFVKPKIEQLQDKAIIEQSLVVLENIDNQIKSVIQGGPGNRRIMDIGLKKGDLNIDAKNEQILFSLESKQMYSEEGEVVDIGSVKALTTPYGKNYNVVLWINYSGYDLSYRGDLEEIKTITKSSNPYKFIITNNGTLDSGKIQIDLSVE